MTVYNFRVYGYQQSTNGGVKHLGGKHPPPPLPYAGYTPASLPGFALYYIINTKRGHCWVPIPRNEAKKPCVLD